MSLPQVLLALPVAATRVGLAPGLLIILAVGGLNTLSVAREAAAYFAQHQAVPSLPQLARDRLGPWGGRLGPRRRRTDLRANASGRARPAERLRRIGACGRKGAL